MIIGAKAVVHSGTGKGNIIIDDIDPLDAVAWDAFVINYKDSSLYHLSSWRKIIKNVFGHDSYYLCNKNDLGNITAVLPLIHLKSSIFGSFLVSMPYFNYGGCLANNVSDRVLLHERAIEIAKKVSASHIEFRDVGEIGILDMPERTDKVSMRLGLPDEVDKLWASLGSKLRSQIKRPLRENPVVKTGGADLLNDFYKVFARNMRDLGTPVYSKVFFMEILKAFEGSCHLVVVYKDNSPVAAGFLIGYKGMMEIPWASSLREFNKYGFNMLMYWEALKLSIEKSCHVFDFGRSSKDSGTFRFKKQWGSSPVQMSWHYWKKDGGGIPMLNPSNPKYKLAINMWKRLPVPIANQIGPLIVKNLP
jgi:serine/alanine adding enzyme